MMASQQIKAVLSRVAARGNPAVFWVLTAWSVLSFGGLEFEQISLASHFQIYQLLGWAIYVFGAVLCIGFPKDSKGTGASLHWGLIFIFAHAFLLMDNRRESSNFELELFEPVEIIWWGFRISCG